MTPCLLPLRAFAAAVVVAALGACTALGEGPVLRYVPLEPALAVVAGPALGHALGIDVPLARAPVAGARIATVAADGTLGVLAGGQWTAPAPELLQDVLVTAFEASGRLAGVGRTGDGTRVDCVLLGDLRHFEYQRAAGRVQVAFAARLACGVAGRIVASQRFEAGAGVAGAGLPAVGQAFAAATTELVAGVVAWSFDALAAVPPSAR